MALFSSKERIAVFRGGQRATNRRSMESGAAMIEVLKAQRQYSPCDVIVSPQGEWLVAGRVVRPESILHTVDAAVIAVLGEYGEDGQIVRELERHGVRHTSAPPHIAFDTYQKNVLAERLHQKGVCTPRRLVAYRQSSADWHALAAKVQDLFGPHYIVKPLSGTQHQAVYRVVGPAALPKAITAVLSEHPACLIEEYIDGQAVTVTSVPGLRGQRLYHTSCLRFDHQFTDDGQLAPNSIVTDALLSRTQREAVHEAVRSVYVELGLACATRTDAVVTATDQIYIIETNIVTPVDPQSATYATLQSVGVTLEEYLTHQLAD